MWKESIFGILCFKIIYFSIYIFSVKNSAFFLFCLQDFKGFTEDSLESEKL